MPNRVRNILIAPRTWLALGAFCIGSSLAVGYHEEYRSAQQVLHDRVGLPEEVLIQNFAPDLHMNLIRQASVLGEIVEGQSTALNIGTPEAPRWIDVSPIYPVGQEFLPIAEQRRHAIKGERRRPMPRDRAEEIARLGDAIEGVGGHAFAFVIVDQSSNADAGSGPFGREVIVDGGDRDLVLLTGSIVSGSALMNAISGVMLEHGVPSTPDTLLLEPRTERVFSVFSSGQAAAIGFWLTSLGILCAAVALLAPFLTEARKRRASRIRTPESVEATKTFPAVSFFQPIATQDELAMQDVLEKEKASGQRGGPFAVLRNLAASAAEGFRLRSPQ